MHSSAVSTVAREVTVKLLTAGATLSEAAFSGVGVLVLHGGRWLALGSAGCAAIIEWAVFSPNIAGGIRLLMTEEALLHRLIEQELARKIADQKAAQHQFLQTYQCWLDWQNYYLALSHAHKTKAKSDNSAHQPKSLLECEAGLAFMRKQAAVWSLAEDAVISTQAPLFSSAECEAFRQRFETKTLQLQLACAAIPFAMLGAYFATYAAAVGILPMLPAGMMAAGVLVFFPYAIAALAAIAFGASIFYTVHRMISDDLLRNFWRAQVQQFKEGSGLHRFTLVIAAIIFVGMLAGLLLASGGTWWHSGMQGQAMLFGGSLWLVKVVVGIMVGAYIALTQIFYIKNMIQSLNLLFAMQPGQVVADLGRVIGSFFSSRYATILGPASRVAHAPRILRPVFSLLAVPVLAIRYTVDIIFKCWAAVVFIAHCVSEGVTVDNSFILPAIVAALLRSVQEALTDLHYLTELKSADPRLTSPSASSAAVVHEHDHEHSILPQRVLCVAFSPLLIVLCAAQYALAHRPTAGFIQLLKYYWGDSHCHRHTQPSLPTQVPANLFQVRQQGTRGSTRSDGALIAETLGV